MHQVVLGQKYKDPITGYSGVATSRTVYLNGCVRICLTGKAGKDGKIPEEFFDEQQILGNVTPRETGGPAPKPKMPKDPPVPGRR